MSRKGRKKKLRITIVANDPRDAKRILDAIGEAARTESPKRKEPLAPTALPDITTTIPDEQLETRVNEAASERLRELQKAAIECNREKGLSSDGRNRGSPEEIVARRSDVRKAARKIRRFARLAVDVLIEVVFG